MKLIEARLAARLWSVRVAAAATALWAFLLAAPDQALAIWQALPPEVQAWLPNFREVGLALSVAVIVARVIKQKGHADG